MRIKQYDKILLKNGDYAYIVEIFDDGRVFIADIDRKNGTETDWIRFDDIKEVISRH